MIKVDDRKYFTGSITRHTALDIVSHDRKAEADLANLVVSVQLNISSLSAVLGQMEELHCVVIATYNNTNTRLCC